MHIFYHTQKPLSIYNDAAGNSLRTKDQTLILVKPEDGWAPATYYAKFEPDVAPLTIERENGEPDQVYVYEIKKINDPDFVIYVTITGSGSATFAEAIQSEPANAVTDSWKVTLDSNNYIVSAP